MTTFTIHGIRTDYDLGDNVSAVSATILEVVVGTNSDGTFTYSLLPGGGPGEFPEVDISASDFAEARIDGQLTAESATSSLGQIQWSGNTSYILEFSSNPPLDVPATDWLFNLGGTPLPNFATAPDPVAAFAAFEAQVTGIGPVTSGPFAPNTVIGFAGLLNTTTGQNDVFNGTPGDDVFDGGAGHDTINGVGGNDTLFGGTGNDTIRGGNGTDYIEGGDGNDYLNPGDNTDYDDVRPGAGIDTVDFSHLHGYAGLLHSDLDARVIVNIDGAANTGIVKKGANGTTTITNVNNALQGDGLGINGTAFNDVYNINDGNGGWMQLRAGAGDDRFNIDTDNITVRLDYRGAANGVTANLHSKRVKDDGFGDRDVIVGQGHVDEIRTGMFDDRVTGSGSNESFILMAGNDVLNGGGGFDRLRYDRTGVDGVTVDLESGTASGHWRGEAFSHTISNIEHVRGSSGDDMLSGSNTKDDLLDGRDGDDTLKGRGGDDTLNGEHGNDTLNGGHGDDRMDGGEGNDKLRGGDGSDVLMGGNGNDYLNPGDNSYYDHVYAGAGHDKVDFSGLSQGYARLLHNDLNARIVVNIDGNANTGTINKGANGKTTITNVENPMLASVSSDFGGFGLFGTAFDDIINVTVSDGGWAHLVGEAGNDRFTIGASSGYLRLDYVTGVMGVIANLGTGRVNNDGFGDADRIFGTGEVYELRTTHFDDTVTGSSADESFILRGGVDTLNGRGGFDRLRYDRDGVVDGVTVDLEAGTATGTWHGHSFSHTIRNIEHVRGSSANDTMVGSNSQGDLLEGRDGNDRIIGGDGDDNLKGDGGRDFLTGGTGGDALDGGHGTDTASYLTASAGVTANMADSSVNAGDAAGDTYASIENLWGSLHRDALVGDQGENSVEGRGGADRIDGRGRDDVLNGGGGNDRLDGGKGNDTLTGGANSDTFVFGLGHDVITDFGNGNDRLKLNDALWGNANLSTAEILDFATVVNGDTVFDFGGGNTLTLENYTDIAGLGDDLLVF